MPAFGLSGLRASWLRRFPALLQSAAFRFALLYVVLFGVSTAALATIVWWQTAGLLARQTDAAIDADVQGLSERWNEGGTPALLATIKARLADDPNQLAVYLLADPVFSPVLGNLGRWPGDAQATNWFEVPVVRNGTRTVARLHRFDLPDGYHLLVGRDAEFGAQLQQLLTGALSWAAVVVPLLGTGGAIVVRGVFRRALAGVFATAAAISNGDLAQRVPRNGSGDQFDSLAETINEMLDRINRLMQGVRHVSDAIAHDLRTPIARARVRLEDAARHAHGPEDLHAAIDRAQADLDGVISMFEALLRITEIEAGARHAAFMHLDIVPLIRDLAEFYEAMAEDVCCQIVVVAPQSAWILGDRTLVQRAVANLVENAIKFSRNGGPVHVTVHEGATCSIMICDRGMGMSDADRERAGNRFFRAETARSTPGSGLGLSLVQAVAHLHGGTLTLSDNAPGLCAKLTLPGDGHD